MTNPVFRSLLFVVAAVLLACGATPLFAAIPQSERDALIALYDSTDGSNWSNKTNWLGPAGSECTWFGVRCDAGGDHVTVLSIQSNNMSGPIPPAVANLSSLTYFNLEFNQLSGGIPPEISALTNLQSLYLGSNRLSGGIPPEIGRLSSLVYLRLIHNELVGSIPAEIGDLMNLEHLDLGSNRLTGGIPPEIGGLESLVTLAIYQTELGGSIPPQIGDLSNLELLSLYRSRLEGSIPAEIGNLAQLSGLYLSQNELSGSIPSEMGNLSSLTSLTLELNLLTGALPPSLAKLGGVTRLQIDHNALLAPDDAAKAWADARQPGWQSTQTVAPANVEIVGTTKTSVTVQWEPIEYSAGIGRYEVWADSGTGLELLSRTKDKYVSKMSVDGLSSGTTYSFRLRTISEHYFVGGHNILASEFSESVEATTQFDLPALFVGSVGVAEGHAATVTAKFVATLSKASPKVVSVSWTTKDGTAVAGEDYVAASGSITFNPGETLAAISVDVIGDRIEEDDETFVVELKGPTNATIAQGQGICTIVDDDGLPSLSIRDTTVTEGTGGTTDARFRVFLSREAESTVTVRVRTSDITAKSGEDYETLDELLSFEPGVTSKVITVKVIGDATEEDAEAFAVNLLEPVTNASIRDFRGIGTIVDDDDPICNSAPSDLAMEWRGLVSGCSSAKACRADEPIRFKLIEGGDYQLQSCDRVEWNFGDGSTQSSRDPVTHVYEGIGPYRVDLSVSNRLGTWVASGIVLFGDPNVAKPTVSVSPAAVRADAGSTIAFIGSASTDSQHPIIAYDWRIVQVFGGMSSVIRTVRNEGGIEHTFQESGYYQIRFTATNAGGTSDPAVAHVEIVDAMVHEFLIPVVAHLQGNNGTQWRTDLQIFNTDPSNDPIEFEFEFRGGAGTFVREITVNSSTKVFEDFLRVLAAPFAFNDAGPVIVRARGDSPPQMWTRTYTVDKSGVGSYGQLIPAVSLDAVQEEDRATYVLPGLEISEQFRTNIGLVNPSATSVTVTVMATDDSLAGLRIGEFSVEVPPFALTQIGDLANRIEGLGNGAPFSLRVSTSGDEPLVVYGSMIDQISNDPVFVAGVRDVDQEGLNKKTQIVPGAGHLEQSNGTWRSDVVIYNGDLIPIHFDLVYYDGAGNRRAEANDQLLGPGAFVRVEDVLQWDQLDTNPGDSFGSIKIITRETVNRYPIVLQRTHKDRGELGTFGQGMWAISPDEANVKPGQAAYVPGVRSDDSYYTNLGLIAVGDEPTEVMVTLLDDLDGTPIGSWQYVVDGKVAAIPPDGSIIATNIIRAMSQSAKRGTLRIEVMSGGPVWAYASVIAAADPACGCTLPEHTFDPEYIPAMPIIE